LKLLESWARSPIADSVDFLARRSVRKSHDGRRSAFRPIGSPWLWIGPDDHASL